VTNNGRERATLERTLGLGTVVLIGLAYMTPLIVLGTYGVVAQLSNGTVPTAYLVTLVAMLFTALSYGRMASRGVANSAFCVDERGTIAAVYRKVQLYKGGESEAFVAGDELLVVELRRIRIGLMICFDVEFPEVARAIARGGADLFVTISANMEPFGNDHAVFCSARAIENGLPHVYVNQVGPAGTLNFVGGSTVVSADGEIRALASSSEEEIPTVSLLLPERSSIREDYLKELRSLMPGVRNVISGAESVTRIET
jgi:predicted amidohydrolase